MHAIIVAGSTLGSPLDRALLSEADLLIAADGGAEAVQAAGLFPHLLVGDFDSISDDTRRSMELKGVETVMLPVAKDETDSEVALRIAADRGARSITVHGALGGPRLDHLLGMIALLTAEWLQGVDCRLVDDRQEIYLASGDRIIEGRAGDIVSLLPVTPVVEDVRTEGLLYPLRGEALLQGASRGVSNEMVGRRARVSHGSGHLLITRFHGGGPTDGVALRLKEGS